MKHKHILFGLLALIAASCSNDEMNEVVEMKQNGIPVTADFGADTRINFSEEANVKFTICISADASELPESTHKYI